jgi:hypothetical protein
VNGDRRIRHSALSEERQATIATLTRILKEQQRAGAVVSLSTSHPAMLFLLSSLTNSSPFVVDDGFLEGMNTGAYVSPQ